MAGSKIWPKHLAERCRNSIFKRAITIIKEGPPTRWHTTVKMRFKSDAQRKAMFSRMNRMSMGGDVGFGYGESDYDEEFSKRGVIQLKPYDVNAIPKEILREAGMTKEEAQNLYDRHGIRISRMSDGVQQIKIGDRIIGLGDEYHYEFYPGVVKEVSDDKALIIFDETKNEVWYPIERLLSQDMLDKKAFRGVRSS